MSPPARPWTDPELLRAHFEARAQALRQHAEIWAPRPFLDTEVPWEREHPALSAWLRALPDSAIEALEPDPSLAIEAPQPFGRWAQAGVVEEPGLWSASPELGRLPDMPARKSAQVRGFVTSVRPQLPSSVKRVLDWCSGHGHLGRTLAGELPLRCVERDPALCERGRILGAAQGAEFYALDALSPQAAALLEPGVAGVALHACGQLGDTLLGEGAARGAALLALAPCCYHRRQEQDPVWRSARGRSLGLELTPSLTRLATSEEVVASPRERARRRQELGWRKGLDLLLREQGRTQYQSFPSVRRWSQVPNFRSFCEHLLASKGLSLSGPIDWDRAEAEGIRRARLVRALALPRALFRRPMEQLLVLDRALWLLEQDRQVGLGRFCPRHASPRDLLLISW